MYRNENSLLSKLVDNSKSFLMKSIKIEFYSCSKMENCLRDL